MRRLYLQVYLTIVGSLILVVLTAGMLWHFAAAVSPFDQRFDAVGEIVAELVPAADAPRDVQQRTITRLARRLDADLALFAPTGELVASAGRPLPPPDPRGRALGWRPGPEGPVLSIPLPDRRWLVARVPPGPRTHALAMVIFLGAIALAVAIGALPVVRRLTRRLERLQQGVESLGAGDLAARVKVEGRDEVAHLAGSFNRAAARIESLVNAHRMLLANASHELRTPLTRIRFGLELAGASPARKAEIEKDIAELDQLVDEILLMSRLDTIDEFASDEEIDLVALAAEECARFKDCGVEGKGALVRGDPTLLRRVVRNLVENAERHGVPPIEVKVETVGARVRLAVSDRGPIIPASERERLFAPFYRGPGTGPKGVGLGLALVRQIARRHGGDVVYNPQRGNCFEVTLPAVGRRAASSGRAASPVAATPS